MLTDRSFRCRLLFIIFNHCKLFLISSCELLININSPFPFDSVSSGGQGMAFYWRGNQLVTKHSRIDNRDKIWTTFVMDVRDPEEVKKTLFTLLKDYISFSLCLTFFFH